MTLELSGDTIPIKPTSDMIITDRRKDLEQKLKDSEFASYYGSDQAKTELAFTLIAARDQLNLTQTEVANKLKVSQPYIAQLERGDANPSIGRIGSLLAQLDLRLNTRTEPLLPQPVAPQIAFRANVVLSFPSTAVDTAVSAGISFIEGSSKILPSNQRTILANGAAAGNPSMAIVDITKPTLVGGAVE